MGNVCSVLCGGGSSLDIYIKKSEKAEREREREMGRMKRGREIYIAIVHMRIFN